MNSFTILWIIGIILFIINTAINGINYKLRAYRTTETLLYIGLMLFPLVNMAVFFISMYINLKDEIK